MKKGYILIDVLLTVILITILGASLLDGYFNTISMRRNLNDRVELYEVAENQLENITAAAYSGENYEVLSKDNINCHIEKSSYSENLDRYEVTCKDEDREVHFEKILTNKRLHSN